MALGGIGCSASRLDRARASKRVIDLDVECDDVLAFDAAVGSSADVWPDVHASTCCCLLVLCPYVPSEAMLREPVLYLANNKHLCIPAEWRASVHNSIARLVPTSI